MNLDEFDKLHARDAFLFPQRPEKAEPWIVGGIMAAVAKILGGRNVNVTIDPPKMSPSGIISSITISSER